MNKRVSIITLGCKVNKYESECMANILKNDGFEVFFEMEPADIYIINSCAVTQTSEKKSRQHIAKIKKINPEAQIIVCGCASENNSEQFKKENCNVVTFGTQNKSKILEYIKNIPFEKCDYSNIYENLNDPYISSTRAYLKIQDGCNNFCSYCLIPYVRGRSRSRDLSDLINEAEKLSKGFKEIVLIGINLSDYKINGKLALGTVMQELGKVSARIRISSLEVNVINDDFLAILKNMHNFAPSFHLSLQSGDNEVLKKMNRKYTREEYIQKCDLIRKYFPTANITTDIIVGFPGETDEQFENTIALAKRVEFGKIHVFPYSKRAGTVASRMAEVSSAIKKERVKKLSALGEELAENYYKKFIGKVAEVLFEDEENGFMVGFSENYMKVYAKKSDAVKSGALVKMKLVELFEEGFKGEIYG